ncbi:phage recombination protein Bet [Photobacterium phosphoreum]|uniref:Phage recombination protein Bet n=1 Tax=Photobacterium phosphoreum TaxID=659 RepID=A0A2T3JPY1_PHOPO|nr:phage recombination protein Bet [Photobacterium phosphoreum]PSU24714.1 phage recombination protein Bet [Photobacterium phosphoreum]PSU38578.1 phage recombination protein Bet [Photobacterium phosphoreum]PSU51112.1 phage recombination protein Bet [Photobacterium phosphoreum]
MNTQSTVPFEQQYPAVAQRGIDQSTWGALQNSVFPGARDESILMAVDYCLSRHLDILLKPVHLVPMSVKDASSGNSTWRDVVMPGIGLYRIQADRSGTYAGADEPEFGPVLTADLDGNQYTFPEWCKYTVHKLIGDRIVAFSAKEYWLENYATSGRNAQAPNAMWKKRPYAQLAKCAEAQALRKAWPDIGQAPTAEEMEGKEFVPSEKDITPQKPTIKHYPVDQFELNYTKWSSVIQSGKKTAEQLIAMIESKGQLTEPQKQALINCEAEEI